MGDEYFDVDNFHDPDHPYYLYPLDNPSLIIVPKQFNYSGFRGWSRSILFSLGAKNKLEFIDGSFVKPSSTSPLAKQWERCNYMISSWLLNALSPDIVDSAIYSKNASQMWDDLNERFGQANVARWYRVQKDLSIVSKGSCDIQSYFTKVKRLWDELDSLSSSGCTCDCTCWGKEKAQKDKKIQN
ncbi:uncharacterized protein LOC107798350 [Nicotiana tabacum]|uniref:Uncharacterized protein LOC107798350 n=1 Tax=Nicotiana tabacum TaxID=4097 RepID=A0A1S4AJI9_TOBAC|nr:PREDICTED: uncharacterized protein LOC107798350 [Nicotiana tabacum]